MEQATTIKEKREFEKEMGMLLLWIWWFGPLLTNFPNAADVREFADNFVGGERSRRSKDQKPAKKSSGDDEPNYDNESPDSDEGVKPRRPGVSDCIFHRRKSRPIGCHLFRMHIEVFWHSLAIKATRKTRRYVQDLKYVSTNLFYALPYSLAYCNAHEEHQCSECIVFLTSISENRASFNILRVRVGVNMTCKFKSVEVKSRVPVAQIPEMY